MSYAAQRPLPLRVLFLANSAVNNTPNGFHPGTQAWLTGLPEQGACAGISRVDVITMWLATRHYANCTSGEEIASQRITVVLVE